jgi:hypothetical protein
MENEGRTGGGENIDQPSTARLWVCGTSIRAVKRVNMVFMSGLFGFRAVRLPDVQIRAAEV